MIYVTSIQQILCHNITCGNIICDDISYDYMLYMSYILYNINMT